MRGASLEVPRGAVYALMGANGAGKSTLLKAACGMCRTQRGHVEVLGRDLRRYRGAELFRGCMAMLPQDPASLFVKETVRGELAEMSGASGAGRPCRADRSSGAGRPCEPGCLEAVAELCAVERLLERNPCDLSGGERQRVALAKVLLTDPQLVLLDEPTKGLDAAAKREFARLLGQMATRGVTVLMVSHDVEFCAEHATRVGMFFDGQVVAEADPREFFLANAFYTTAARRMGRGLVEGAVTVEDLLAACRGAGDETGRAQGHRGCLRAFGAARRGEDVRSTRRHGCPRCGDPVARDRLARPLVLPHGHARGGRVDAAVLCPF